MTGQDQANQGAQVFAQNLFGDISMFVKAKLDQQAIVDSLLTKEVKDLRLENHGIRAEAVKYREENARLTGKVNALAVRLEKKDKIVFKYQKKYGTLDQSSEDDSEAITHEEQPEIREPGKAGGRSMVKPVVQLVSSPRPEDT